ncbi:MAG: shikimate kinase [Pirellulaceae bacterium]|nr:shikimate kinase [Pirellulaceae bacterium]
MNILLIGYRGVGKTTVAELLSERLGWPWMDTDVLIEAAGGKPIKEIFANDGERRFRDLETEVILETCRKPHCVIALGGGAVLREQNRATIEPDSSVVWLRASVATIRSRILADPTTLSRRPNLTARGGESEIRLLLEERSPIYRSCANIEVHVDDKAPHDVVMEILAQLELGIEG